MLLKRGLLFIFEILFGIGPNQEWLNLEPDMSGTSERNARANYLMVFVIYVEFFKYITIHT